MIGSLAKMRLLHLVFIKPHICWADSPAALNVTSQRPSQTLPLTLCWPQVFNRWLSCLHESLKHQSRSITGIWLDQTPYHQRIINRLSMFCQTMRSPVRDLKNGFFLLESVLSKIEPTPLLCALLIWATGLRFEKNMLIQGSQQLQSPPDISQQPHRPAVLYGSFSGYK